MKGWVVAVLGGVLLGGLLLALTQWAAPQGAERVTVCYGTGAQRVCVDAPASARVPETPCGGGR